MAHHDIFHARPAMTLLGEANGPGWGPGLRQLYKAVPNEALPGDFGDLLAGMERRYKPTKGF